METYLYPFFSLKWKAYENKNNKIAYYAKDNDTYKTNQ